MNALMIETKTAVFAEARRLGLASDDAELDDRLYRARAVELIQPLTPIHGSKGRGFTEPLKERFFAILRISNAIPGERPRYSEIAYELCRSGATDVPGSLVCEHVEASIEALLRLLERSLNRVGKGYLLSYGDASLLDLLARYVARWFVRRFTPLKNEIARQVVEAALSLSLRTIRKRVTYASVAPLFYRFCVVITGNPNPSPAAVKDFWDLLAEGFQVFALDREQNALLRAVRDVRKYDPSEIIRFVQLGDRILEAAATTFPWINDLRVLDPWLHGTPEFYDTLNRHYRAAACATLVLTRESAHAKEMAAALAMGNDEMARRTFRELKDVTDQIAFNIGVRAPLIPSLCQAEAP